MISKLRGLAPPLVLLGLLVAVWQLQAGRSESRNPVLPPPSRVVRALVDTRSLLVDHAVTTLQETALGALAGIAIGLVLAVLVASWPLARRSLQPLLVASQTVPVQVIAPLLVLWFGFGLMPKVVVVALIVLFPVAVATAAGIESADRELVDLVRAYGAGRLRLMRMVLLPAAVPGLFAGLRISLTYAIAGAVIGESIGATSGLGLYLDRSRRAFRYDQVLAGVVVIALLSMALYLLVHVAYRLACPWLHLDGERLPTNRPQRRNSP